ncbi:MAG: hypothetical protein KA397_00830 [Paludibacteraceae bacterium]|nr:hypothetical protein [Paludibacteraceae bacterium]MBP6283797.1 hypothetical protein [Paludibacteraceae bacterium]
MPSFFHRPKPRQFHVTPRYYDEHKERIAESQKRVGLDKENEGKNRTTYSSSIKGTFGNVSEMMKSKNRQNIRMGVILGVVALVLYFLFK